MAFFSRLRMKAVSWLWLISLLMGCAAPPAEYVPYYLVTAAPFLTPTAFQPPLAPPTWAPTPSPSSPPRVSAVAVPAATVNLPPSSPSLSAPTASPGGLLPAAEIPSDFFSILLLGSDLRTGASFRTDTLIVALLRPQAGQVALISIPRDLWVTIPTVGEQRINTAYQFGEVNGYPGGGAALLRDTLAQTLGLEIQHTAMVDFDGFRQIVDTLGGVDVPIACPYTDWRLIAPDLNPEDENNWALYTAGPGLLHMDGDLALWYARSRKKSNDFDRGRRQQETLRALFRQAAQSGSFTHLPELYSAFSGSVVTDLNLPALLGLVPLALKMNNADIRSYYLAGEMVTPWVTPGGAWVLLPNPEPIQAMLAQALSPSTLQAERSQWRVEVQNGTSNAAWDALAAERLNYAGYQTHLFPADNREHFVTLLYDLTPDQDAQRAQALLAVLGLGPQAWVHVPTEGQTDYVVLLGADYVPCFQPQNLAP